MAFIEKILSLDWILLVANPGPGEEAPLSPCPNPGPGGKLFPLLVHLTPDMDTGVVQPQEEAAKDVAEDGRKSSHHQELQAGREPKAGELPIALHESGGDDGGDGGVDQHTGQGNGLLWSQAKK